MKRVIVICLFFNILTNAMAICTVSHQSVADKDSISVKPIKSEPLKFKSLMYVYSYSSMYNLNNSAATTYGFQYDGYRARKKKIGYGSSMTAILSNYALDDNIELLNTAVSFSIGPGYLIVNSDRLNIWLAAYVGAAFNSKSHYYDDVTDDNPTEPELSDFEDTVDYSFYPDLSAQASFMLLGRFGVVAKVGWSDVYVASVGLSIGPKKK